MSKEFERLSELVRNSTRTVLDPRWLEDELLAIKHFGASKGMLDLYEDGRVFSNENHSAVAYVIGITNNSPTQPAVVIENARVNPPDIDIDFEDTRREEVKEYLTKKWKNVVSISTYSKFSSRGLVRDLCRVFAIPLEEVNRVCKQFDTIEEFESSQTCKWFRDKYPEIHHYAERFEGRWRSSGVHAAGMVVSNKKLDEVMPLESRKVGKDKGSRLPVSAFDMEDVEELGLIKFDILGISALTVISNCLKLIEERHDKKINLYSLVLDDKEVFENFSSGRTVGVFQAEAAPYTNLLRRMGAETFDDLVVSNALVRPGPLTTVGESYIRRKKGIEGYSGEHPIIAEINSMTYNLFIFQEQLIEALVKIGGFSWPEADYVRKIIGKKRDTAEFDKYKDKWVKNATEKIGTLKAKKLWADFIHFSNYAFNLAHSVAYSMLSYFTMWLKVKYPVEYMFCLIEHEKSMDKRTTFFIECGRLGIDLLLPDINLSGESLTINNNSIRLGFGNIKGIGPEAAKELNEKGPYESYSDLVSKTTRRKVNQRILETLSQAGLLHDFEDYDCEEKHDKYLYDLMGIPSKILSSTSLPIKLDMTNMIDYDPKKVNIVRGIVKNIRSFPSYMRIEVEDSTGLRFFYLDGKIMPEKGKVIIGIATYQSMSAFTHEEDLISKVEGDYKLAPFEKFLLGKIFNQEKVLYNYEVGRLDNEKSLVVPISIRKFKTKRGSMMARMIVSDGEAVENIVVFPKQYARLGSRLSTFSPIVIKKSKLDDGYAMEDMISAYELVKRKGL